MTIGKREQIVIGIIAAIIVLALLHLLIFARQIASQKEAKSKFDSLAGQIAAISQAPSQKVLDDYTSKTQSFFHLVKGGVKQVGLTTLPEFDLPDPAKDKDQKGFNAKLSVQLDDVMKEVDALASLSRSASTRMTFLGQQGWALASDLPESMRNAALWDALNEIKDRHDIIQRSSEGLLRQSMEARYNALVLQLGLDASKAASLFVYGEYVPIIYKLQVVNAILKQVKAGGDQKIRDKPVTRDYLMDILNIERPIQLIPNLSSAQTATYFIYQSLADVIELAEMAQSHGVVAISDVRLWGNSYLRKGPASPTLPSQTVAPPSSLSDDRLLAYNFAPTTDGGQTAATPVMAGTTVPGVPVETDVNINKPLDGDIGYAIPIEVTFLASNKEGLTYIYDVVHKTPLNQLYRIEMHSLSSANNQSDSAIIEFKVIFLFVPKLFQALDAVNQLIKDLEAPAASATVAAAK